jgi:hypothetical protein
MNDINTLILIDNTAEQEQVPFRELPVNSVFEINGAVYLKIGDFSGTSALNLKIGYVRGPISDHVLVTPVKATLTIEKV